MLDHKTLAELSLQAYNESTWSTENGTDVLFKMVDDHAVIIPRGTEKNYEDILTDFQGWPFYDKTLGVWGHYGVRKSAYQVWPEISELLTQKGLPVVFTGHSLGAAIATWLALIMLSWEKCPEQLVCFGSPGCVSPKGGKLLLENKIPVTLYKYGIDIVTTLPKFQRKIGLIKHVAPQTRVGPKGDGFEDHRMTGYVREAPADPPQFPFDMASNPPSA